MENNQDTVSKLTGAAGIVMIATLLSRITGFLRSLLITTNMLPQGYSDEFLLAFTLPDLVYDLLAGGAIAAALIPVLSTYIAKGREKTGWKAISTFMNLTVIILIVLEIIFFVFTDDLLSILAAGYEEGSSGDKALLIDLTRILLLSAPFMMMAGQLNGILNSYKKFAVAAFGPVIYNLCTILSIAVFGAKSVYLTAWGVVIGAMIFFLVQFSACFKHFSLYRPKIYIKSPAFRRLATLAVPSLISSTIIEINLIISKSYATYFDEGMVTLLNSANRTWQLPLGLFAQSIGVAILPTLSEKFASGSYENFKHLLYKGLRVVYILSMPTSIIMIILSQDIFRAMFKWGGFSEVNVFYGGLCLMGYSAALIFASVISLMTRAFYSIHNSKTPLLCSLFGIGANYLFNYLFNRFSDIGIAGTALAYSISSFVNMIALILAFKRRTGVDIIAENFGFMGKALVSVTASGGITYILSVLIRPDINSKFSQVAALILPMAAGLGVFWLIMGRLKVPEIKYVNELFLSRIKKVVQYIT
ncbi:MAG: murein biosynthesis integral membrane protein MurJ [Clostridiaceae bacterium]|nr:murein biosynthesis integral membrane protein MurJ [Clostridiaceae bacterium]